MLPDELPMCGFIAQLVEHRTGIAEVMGSNPVEALNFFQASSFQLLKLENSMRGSFFTFIITTVQIHDLFHIYFHQALVCGVICRKKNFDLVKSSNFYAPSKPSFQWFATAHGESGES